MCDAQLCLFVEMHLDAFVCLFLHVQKPSEPNAALLLVCTSMRHINC